MSAPKLSLRLARLGDMSLVYAWRNHPDIIELSLSRRVIPWSEHQRWFRETIVSRDTPFFLIEEAGVPIGILRFERPDERTAVISIFLMPDFTGQGKGVSAIRLGCEWAASHWGPIDVVAQVRSDNLRSISAFRKAGFLVRQSPGTGDHGVDLDFWVLAKRIKPVEPAIGTRASGSTAEDDARNVDFYTKRFQQYGISVESLNWGSRDSQRTRFAVLADTADLDGRSVLDVGCGLGDFLAWFQERGISVDYTGIDLTPSLIASCHGRFPSSRFLVCDLLAADNPLAQGFESFDYVFASGIFYLRSHEPKQYLESMIKAMVARSRRGVAFNSLSAWCPSPIDPGEFRADPAETLETARKVLPWAVMRHDYHPCDFTISLRRERYQS